MNYTENVIVPERTLLVSLDTGEYDAEESLRELWELAKSGGAEPIATMMQKRPSPETATCVGSGMVEEIRNFCENNEIELIIFDRELTPTQIRNLENATDVRVVDRTMLILDIFAQRAQSRAGKVQVEAAQLKYLLPRLTGKGTALSRLGGGIGTRGPGETKLETDRRHIRRRIEALREQLKKIEVGRHETQRRRALADVKEFFLRAGALAALLLVLFGVVFGLAIQPDDTMYPHLKPGDLLLYYRLPRSFAASSASFSRITPWNTSFPTTIITSRKRTLRRRIPILKKTVPSTRRSISCATAPPVRFLSGGTSLSSRPFRAFTA